MQRRCGVLIVLLSAGAILTLAHGDEIKSRQSQETPAVRQSLRKHSRCQGRRQRRCSRNVERVFRCWDSTRHFSSQFKDNEPLSEEEQTKLAKLLQGLPRIAKSTLLEAAGRQASLEPTSLERPAKSRQAYALRVLLRHSHTPGGAGSVARNSGYDSYFRCDVETVARRMVILVRPGVRAWKLDRPLNLPGQCDCDLHQANAERHAAQER